MIRLCYYQDMAKWRYSNKERAFVEHYLRTWNGTKACRDSGYRGNDNVLGVMAYRMLRKDKIQALIQRRMKELTISANEVLIRLAQHATSSMTDFVNESGIIDWKAVKEKGHVIKKITHIKGARSIIELYDGQAALVHLGRHYALFKDRIQVEDWRTEIIQLLREGKISPEQVMNELGKDLATELFISAGISIAAS